MWDAFSQVLVKGRASVLFVIGGLLLLVLGSARSLVILGADLTVRHPLLSWVLVGLGVLLLAAGVAAHFLRPESADPPSPARLGQGQSGPRYDVFLAVPMSGTRDEDEYRDLRRLALDVIAALEAHCGVRQVYFSGRKLNTRADFESEAVSAQVDFEALRSADHFVMIYPRPVLSSVIAEAGFAIAQGIPSVYLAQGETNLPFLLNEAHALTQPEFPVVVIHHYQDAARLLKLIENDGRNFLPWPTRPAVRP